MRMHVRSQSKWWINLPHGILLVYHLFQANLGNLPRARKVVHNYFWFHIDNQM